MMKQNCSILYRTLLILVSTCACIYAEGQPSNDFTGSFQQAADAYDNNQPHKAIALYEKLLEQKAFNSSVFYNLGNAYYHNDQPELAVLNYKRALFLRPRDPDIKGNLNFVMARTGALLPELSTADRLLRSLSFNEWIWLSLFSFWILMAMAILWLLDQRHRYLYSKILTLAITALILCFSGIFQWRNLMNTPEAVITALHENALFAPIEGSTAHFSLPPGSVVRIRKQDNTWIKVFADHKEGWVKSVNCHPVYPWQKDL